MNNEFNNEISGKVLKTGTVTMGIVCKDGIILAADRRVSYGAPGGGVSYFADQLKKIIQINDNLVTTIAGGAADAKRTLSIIKAELRLKELRSKEKVEVNEAANFLANMVYNNIRTPSMIPNIAHFLLAGYDDTGYHLYDIGPDGHIKLAKKYATSGAGIMQVDPIVDTEYKEGMSLEEGIALVRKCIIAATGREPSVGAGMDIYKITKDSVIQVVEQQANTVFNDVKS